MIVNACMLVVCLCGHYRTSKNW